ncbi:hypothetical protein BC937DRAFT_90825 [Endogone sp. FLAS-F59071]|nr:hypothetical protein BC937DRAFT_90825 [Endogone sp. FLAS-F59071]|eukprot:RUS16772.1 hypothetical protein BC937DRAFT_90825 [Endogone sp. FLAS-F59071]
MVAEQTSKRPKSIKDRPQQSRIFQPFRALGYVTNNQPFSLHSKGQQYFLTTSIGSSFQIYNVAKMSLLFVGPQTQKPITALASSGDLTFAACGNEVITFRRSKEISRINSQDHFTVFQLLVFGGHLISLCDDNTLKMWDYTTGELYTELEFDPNFTLSTLIHPSTYLNKVLLGSSQGTMQIWNVRTSSPITSLIQSPVVDVVAVGLLDGTVLIHNIKVDETIMILNQEDRVTAISFRTDDQHIMASASMHGDIALWDLDKRKLVHVMRGAHDGFIPSIQFLNGQPILAYVIPSPFSHCCCRTNLILGSLSKKSKILNLKVDELKLPQVIYFAASDAKQKEWDNILTCHLNDTGARSWSYQRKALGNHVLASKDRSQIKVVAISACGNFGLIGSSSGSIDMFNMQSGFHRKAFAGHTKAITGLVTDNFNRIVISSSIDATIKVGSLAFLAAIGIIDSCVKVDIWNFQSTEVLYSIQLPSPVALIIYQRENNLLAVASDDLCIRILDVETQRIVREFWGHSSRVSDMTFSPDGRWVVSSSLDSTIRTWDLPSGNLVDSFKVDSVATSVTFSPTGDFLATAHVDNLGIFLWLVIRLSVA